MRAPTAISAVVVLVAAGCGYNGVIDKDEAVKAAWSEVENQYQRRADLVPNLVATIKGASAFEKDTLTAVVEARARATSITVDASIIDDPARLQEFQEAQAALSSSLGRLIAVAEAYPELKASEAYRDLLVQLEGTENRIAVARGRYVTAVADYNVYVQRLPTSIGASLRKKAVRPTFDAAAGADVAPKVGF
ncbi:MAG: LemA family protein [Deltaproteobacteria bacterium]|nr:LemA family protein [Deltaproteobacteria bacterium]